MGNQKQFQVIGSHNNLSPSALEIYLNENWDCKINYGLGVKTWYEIHSIHKTPDQTFIILKLHEEQLKK